MASYSATLLIQAFADHSGLGWITTPSPVSVATLSTSIGVVHFGFRPAPQGSRPRAGGGVLSLRRVATRGATPAARTRATRHRSLYYPRNGGATDKTASAGRASSAGCLGETEQTFALRVRRVVRLRQTRVGVRAARSGGRRPPPASRGARAGRGCAAGEGERTFVLAPRAQLGPRSAAPGEIVSSSAAVEGGRVVEPALSGPARPLGSSAPGAGRTMKMPGATSKREVTRWAAAGSKPKRP